MPSLIDIRRRIRSVKNTRQITKAMKMVSAAKLRRAQDRVIAARPYADSMQHMLANVAKAVEEQGDGDIDSLLARRPEQTIQVVVITADRGLVGGFNANVIRAPRNISSGSTARPRSNWSWSAGKAATISGAGIPTSPESTPTLFQKVVRFEDAQAIARKVMERFRKAETDAVYLIVNNFKSVITADLKVLRILPAELPKEQQKINYIFEQSPRELLSALLPRYVEAQIFRAHARVVGSRTRGQHDGDGSGQQERERGYR